MTTTQEHWAVSKVGATIGFGTMLAPAWPVGR